MRKSILAAALSVACITSALADPVVNGDPDTASTKSAHPAPERGRTLQSGRQATVEGMPSQQRPDPTQQALAQMVGDGQNREAATWVQVFTLRAQNEDLKAQLAAETKRADEAEAKLKPADKPAEPAPADK